VALAVHDLNLAALFCDQLLLLAGGISYTVGAIFYAMKRFRYHHMVWHLFVNIGAACHAVGIVFFF
jgi:hemolysin III